MFHPASQNLIPWRLGCSKLHRIRTNGECACEEGFTDGLPTPRHPVGAGDFAACHPQRGPGGRRAAAAQPAHDCTPPAARSGVDPVGVGRCRGAPRGEATIPHLAAPAGNRLTGHRRTLDGNGEAYGGSQRPGSPPECGRSRCRRLRRGPRRLSPRSSALAAPAGPHPPPAPVSGGEPRMWPSLHP